jgi:acyl-CoA synthetase (AMP-forming)/AMP-acid ligase II
MNAPDAGSLRLQNAQAREQADPCRTIGHAIAWRARVTGDSPALVDAESCSVTFSQLHDCIVSIAGRLASAGLTREDRVGLLVPPGALGGQLVVALASNTTLVPLNPALTPPEITEASKSTDLKAIVIPEWLETPARPAILAQGIPILTAVPSPDEGLSLEPLGRPARGPGESVRPARDTDVALILRSSGTTGAPKWIPVTHGNLVAMAQRLGSDLWFRLTAQDRAACILPLYYAAGLKTSLFVPLMLGASVAFPPAGRVLDLGEWVGVLKPTYVSVAPSLLNGILERLRASARRFDGSSLRFVMCAAAYLVEDARRAAKAMLGVPVLEFYGLSEAGVMASNPLPPGKTKPGTVGLPAPGELLIVDGDGNRVPNGTVGEIIVSGPTVTPGYLATEDSICGDLRDGWLRTGDLGRIDDDGYLTLVGREKEMINRGGEKVFPYEVEKALLKHPAVLEAAAFGVPHPRLGENVAAAAVLRSGSTASEEELKRFLAEGLAGFKVPRRIFLISSLPRGNTGKIQRSALSQAYGTASREAAEPFRLLEYELRELWKRLLNTEDIGTNDDFFERGGDSLLATEMLLEVEQLTGKPYPQAELSTLTIGRIADVVASTQASERSLVTKVKSGSGIPLFFCHGDYFHRGIYAHRLAALLPGDQPVFLLHCDADGLTDSTSVEEIASGYVNEVLRLAPDSPVILGGYCNGGLAAWHLAHLLRSRGVQVLELLLIETISLNARPPLRGLRKLLDNAGSMVRGRAGTLLRQHAMQSVWIWLRGDATSGTLLYRGVRKMLFGAMPADSPKTDGTVTGNDLFYRVFQPIISRYVPPRIDVDVTCFIAEKGPHFRTDPNFWQRLAGRVTAVRVPGTHQTVLIAGRESLAKAVAAALKQAEGALQAVPAKEAPPYSTSRAHADECHAADPMSHTVTAFHNEADRTRGLR